jgi:release factor glutamine methyltransferase
MDIQKWLKTAAIKLQDASIESARLDSEILLADLLEKDRSWLHAHPENVLQRSDLRTLDEQLERRRAHEPLAYIRGKQEFYGRDFIVTSDTLTPRPETETMIELTLKYWRGFPTCFIDIGTGSGCIITTLACELNSKSDVFIGTDVSAPALAIAKQNSVNNKSDSHVSFIEHDITNKPLYKVDDSDLDMVILANLPYVPTKTEINSAAKHEPGLAIYGGEDGLDYFRALFDQLRSVKDGIIFTECLKPQQKELASIAKEANYKLVETKDLIQVFTGIVK